jgi:hypothetical protein
MASPPALPASQRNREQRKDQARYEYILKVALHIYKKHVVKGRR